MMIIVTALIVIAALVLYGFFKFFQKQSPHTLKIITIVNSVLILILAFSIAYYVQMNDQLADGRSCLHIARQLSTTFNWHNVDASGINYALKRCANMIPLIYVEALIFKLTALLHLSVTYAQFIGVATYVNTIMLLTSLWLTWRLIHKYCANYIATGFTFLILINVPLYATVYYIYTDIPSLLMIMLMITCYDTFLSTSRLTNKVLAMIGIILFGIIGACFKFNVMIVTMAIAIHYLLSHHFKKAIIFDLLILIMTVCGTKVINNAMVTTSPVPKDEIGLPAINWVNMSFTYPDGGYYGPYFNHTYHIKDQVKTNKKVSQIETKEFFTETLANPKNVANVIYHKIGNTYGIGSYDFYSFFRKEDAVHNNHHFLPELLYGKYSKLYLYSSFVLQLAMFLIMFIGLVKLIIMKQGITFTHVGMIGLFGDMLMLVFWESHARYLLAFVGLILWTTCFAMDKITTDTKINVIKDKY